MQLPTSFRAFRAVSMNILRGDQLGSANLFLPHVLACRLDSESGGILDGIVARIFYSWPG